MMPQRNYPHLLVLVPKPNVSVKPKPQVYVGFANALLIEGVLAGACYVAYLIWRCF